jgi:hypothetical protein
MLESVLGVMSRTTASKSTVSQTVEAEEDAEDVVVHDERFSSTCEPSLSGGRGILHSQSPSTNLHGHSCLSPAIKEHFAATALDCEPQTSDGEPSPQVVGVDTQARDHTGLPYATPRIAAKETVGDDSGESKTANKQSNADIDDLPIDLKAHLHSARSDRGHHPKPYNWSDSPILRSILETKIASTPAFVSFGGYGTQPFIDTACRLTPPTSYITTPGK